MKITKLGHCCLLIETKEKVILTDPGKYTIDAVTDVLVGIILITHEHADHMHVPSIQQLLQVNPNATVVSNTAVQELLSKESIECTIVEDGQHMEVDGVSISGHGDTHAALHSSMPSVQNTGFIIDDTCYHPGDAFALPGKPVDVLALPVAGPWLKIAEAVDFAIAVSPRIAFPVHDDVLAVKSGGAFKAPRTVLPKHGILFLEVQNGDIIDTTHV